MASLKFGAAYGVQAQIDAATWEALENAGCIFLPGARRLDYSSSNMPEISENAFGLWSYYWSSSANNASSAYYATFDFNAKVVTPADRYYSRYNGFSVRLVQDL